MVVKYLRIRDELLERLDTMAPGEPLPSERALAGELGVSRMTLRRAIDELARGGRVVRRPGAGVFAADAKVAQRSQATSFTRDMRERGFVPDSRSLSWEIATAGARWGGKLEVSPGDEVVRVERLRLADGIPMAIEVLVVPRAVAPDLDGDELTGRSFYDLLAERYGVVVTGSVQTIEPTVTDEHESATLGVPLHVPAFLFERTSRDQDGRVVEFVRSVYRGDRYRLVSDTVAPQPVAPEVHAGREVDA